MQYRMYFKNLRRTSIKRRTIEEVARMYLALSGWLSIVLVVALAAWQEDSEQRDDGEARMQSGPYAEVHPLDQVDDEPGHHSYTSHSLR